jgi:hypothetical protein
MVHNVICIHKDEFSKLKVSFIARFCYEVCRNAFRELGKQLPNLSPIKVDIMRFNVTFRLALTRLGYLNYTREQLAHQLIFGTISITQEAWSRKRKQSVYTLQDQVIADHAKNNPRLLLIFLQNFMKESYDILMQDMLDKRADSLIFLSLKLKIQEFTRILKELRSAIPPTSSDKNYSKIILGYTFVELTTDIPIDQFPCPQNR